MKRVRGLIDKCLSTQENRDICMCGFLAMNFILVIIGVIRNVIISYNEKNLFRDHIYVYYECRQALRGIDISEAIRTGLETERVASSSWPWTKVFGIIVHGAFLSEKASCIYEVVFYVSLILLSSVILGKRMTECERGLSSYIGKIQLFLLFLSSWYYIYLACSFNNGAFVCLAIVISVALIQDDHQYLGGVFMAFAMVKAQIAIPFFLVFCLRKKMKVICTSVSVVLVTWISYCVWTGTTPWRQIENILTQQMAGSDAYWLRFGMFDFIMLFDSSKALLCMILSAVVALVVLVVLEIKYIDDDLRSKYVYASYYHAALVALLWMYNSKPDFLILVVVALGMLEMWHRSDKTVDNLLVLCAIIACALMNLTNIMARIISVVLSFDVTVTKRLEGRFDTVMLLGLLVVITRIIYSRGFVSSTNTAMTVDDIR